MRPPRLRVEGGVRALPRLCIKLGPGICLTTEENHGKTSVNADRGKTFIYVPARLDRLWSAPVGAGVSITGNRLSGNGSDRSFYIEPVLLVQSWRAKGQL